MKENLELSFELIEGVLLLSGGVGKYIGNFLFDTGCEQTVINQCYYQVLNPQEQEVAVYEDGMTTTTITTGTIDEFTIGDLNLSDYSVMSMNLSDTENELKEGKNDIHLLGIVGMDLIAQYNVRIDYGNNLIVLNPTEKFVSSTSVEFDFSGGIIVFTAQIDNKDYRFILDSGANICLLREDILNKKWEMVDETQGIYSIPNLSIEGRDYDNVLTVCSNMDILEHLAVDGIINCSALSLKRIDINFGNHKLYFEN